MNRRRFFALAVVVGALPVLAGGRAGRAAEAVSGETVAVQQTFDTLRNALQAGNGKRVMAGLSAASVTRLEAMRKSARHPAGIRGDPGTGPAERLVSESMRRTLTPADLNRRSLDEVVSRALSQREGLGRELVKGSLGPVSVKGDRATAPLLIQGKPSLFQADFVRDSGTWKVDLLPTLRRGDLFLTTMAAVKGSTPDALIDSILAGLGSRLHQPG